MFRKYSGVTGDARSVIGLVGDMRQSGDSEYIQLSKGESCAYVQEMHP